VVVLSPGLGACAFQVSGFRLDQRLTFIAPHNYQVVSLPVTISWEIRDFTPTARRSSVPTPGAGYFALFVDQTPIAPGQTMDAVAAGDNTCDIHMGCPNAQYLAEHQIYTTAKTSFSLQQVATLPNDPYKQQLHQVTIVLLNATGHRIGQSSWTIGFKTKALGA